MTLEAVQPDDSLTRIREAAAAALSRKAEDLKVLDLAEVSDFTEYFLICSGTNERQVQAICDAVEERLRDLQLRPLSIEGYRNGRWVLLDYGSFLVHVFSQDTRAYYRLESLWADGADVTDRVS